MKNEDIKIDNKTQKNFFIILANFQHTNIS